MFLRCFQLSKIAIFILKISFFPYHGCFSLSLLILETLIYSLTRIQIWYYYLRWYINSTKLCIGCRKTFLNVCKCKDYKEVCPWKTTNKIPPGTSTLGCIKLLTLQCIGLVQFCIFYIFILRAQLSSSYLLIIFTFVEIYCCYFTYGQSYTWYTLIKN